MSSIAPRPCQDHLYEQLERLGGALASRLVRLAGGHVWELWQGLREIGQAHLAEVDRLAPDGLGDGDSLEPVLMGELLERSRGEDAVLAVRLPGEYASGHAAGARPVPLDERGARPAENPGGVAYGRGPYGVFAAGYVDRLRRHSRAARRLDLGSTDWKATNAPVEVGAA